MAQTSSRRKKKPPARAAAKPPVRPRAQASPPARARSSHACRAHICPGCPSWSSRRSTRSGSAWWRPACCSGSCSGPAPRAARWARRLSTALRFLVGGVTYLAPLFVIGAGVALAARPHLESPAAHAHRRRSSWSLALTLGFAAGSLGLGPDGGPPRDLFDTDQMMDRGGIAGETLYWATSTLFSNAGAHLAFVFLLLGGLLLLTGASISQLIAGLRSRRTRHAHARGRGAGPGPRGRSARAQGARGARGRAADRGACTTRPEHAPTGEVEIVAAEDEALEAEEEDPLARVEREIRGREPARAPAGGHERSRSSSHRRASAAPPSPSRRASATRCPTPSSCATRQRAGARHVQPGRDLPQLLVETLGHFGIEAKLVGQVTGPRVTRHELRLAPGTKVSKVTQLKDDIAYALASTDIRILAPIPESRRSASRCPTSATGWSTSATSSAATWRRRTARRAAARRCRSGSARTSPATPCGRTSRACRTCSSPARPARGSRAASTRCCPPS